MQRRSLIFVVISVLVVALSYSGFEAFAVPRDPNYVPNEKCTRNMDGTRLTCCWDEPDILNPGEFIRWCQSCDFDGENCGGVFSQSPQPTGPFAPPQDGVLEQPPTPPPSDTVGPLKGGILEQLEQGEGLQQGFFERQQLQPPPADQGAAELPPLTEETQPTAVEEELCPEDQVFNEKTGLCVPEDCPEGQVLDEESGLCVLEEQPAADEEQEEQQQTEEEQPQPEGEQPSEESGSEGDNSNN